jgi:hypothetical protein
MASDTNPVVPDLDPVEHGEGEVLAGVPPVLVEQLALEAGEGRFGDGVEQSPTVPIEPSSQAERSRVPNSHDV